MLEEGEGGGCVSETSVYTHLLANNPAEETTVIHLCAGAGRLTFLTEEGE